MAVLKSYQCQEHDILMHGNRLARIAMLCQSKCSSNLSASSQSALRAPTASSKGLAQDFKMTNIKSTREGRAPDRIPQAQQRPAVQTRARVPKANRLGKEAAERGVMWGGGPNINMGQALSGSLAKPVGPSIGREAESVGFVPARAI
jgi:hypothetical protein